MGKRMLLGGTTAAIVAGALIAAAGGPEGDGAAPTPLAVAPSASVESSAPVAPSPSATPQPSESAQADAPAAHTSAPDGTSQSVTVVHVVDGDTVHASDGSKVRLIGYDTPEVGECGFDEAKALVADLVLDARVDLVNPPQVEDADKYDRVLRYIRVEGVDLGVAVLEAGLANARYDGLDGYDAHPLQDQYREISNRVDHRCAGTAPAQPPEPAPADEAEAGTEAQEPWNQPGPDLDCADIGHPVQITGQDYHRLDRDGDGWACESS